MKITRRVSPHMEHSWYWGLCWHDVRRREIVVTIIPLNYVLSFVRWVYWKIVLGWQSSALERDIDRFRDQYLKGWHDCCMHKGIEPTIDPQHFARRW